jgi:hypothetical protein
LYQHGSNLQLLQSYRTLKCEWIRMGGYKSTRRLMAEIILFTSNSVTVWIQHVFKMTGLRLHGSTMQPAEGKRKVQTSKFNLAFTVCIYYAAC